MNNKTKKQQWRDSRNSLNRFIVNYTLLPLRIYRSNTIQIKKKILDFTVWVNYRAPMDIPVRFGIPDPKFEMITFKTKYIKKGRWINLERFVEESDIEDYSSKFVMGLIGYLQKKNLL